MLLRGCRNEAQKSFSDNGGINFTAGKKKKNRKVRLVLPFATRV